METIESLVISKVINHKEPQRRLSMVTIYDHNRVKGYKTNFTGKKGTSFGGLVLVEKLARRLRLWKNLEKDIPDRRGQFDWMTVIKSATLGLLTGSRGTYATQEIREDKGLLDMAGLSKAPEEATFWRCLEDLGSTVFLKVFTSVLIGWALIIMRRVGINRILRKGFLPVFGDGSLLEGSKKREGTKYIDEKGFGILWTTLFVGPFLAWQWLNPEGEGEGTSLKKGFPLIVEKLLRPLGLKKKALVLMDSLHGNGLMLEILEKQKLFYIVGANQLVETQRTLAAKPDYIWESAGPDPSRNIDESQICYCWLQLLGWEKSRVLVGCRYRKTGEFMWNYCGVLTNLASENVTHLTKSGKSFPKVIWELYDMKMGLENYYKNLLEDLGMHHPPCREHQKNAGFYSLGSLAYTLALGVEMIGSRGMGRGEKKRKDGRDRKRSTPQMMRLWRFIRRYFTMPARIYSRARKVTVEFFGISSIIRDEFEKFWENILRC